MIEAGGPDPGWWQAAAYSFFAATAGVLGYVMRTMDNGARPSFWRAVVEGTSAGFVGLLAMWLCQAAGLSQQWTAVTVGVCGWLGATASIQMLQRFVWAKFGLDRSHGDEPVK
jgi:hypothetical protein